MPRLLVSLPLSLSSSPLRTAVHYDFLIAALFARHDILHELDMPQPKYDGLALS